MREYISMWRNILNFSDKTSIRGFWVAVLVNFLVSLVFGSLIGLLTWIPIIGSIINIIAIIISSVYGLVIFVATLALAVRRLRDSGREWYWALLYLIPVVGWIIMVVLLVQPESDKFPGKTV